jgi:hypothetical protein
MNSRDVNGELSGCYRSPRGWLGWQTWGLILAAVGLTIVASMFRPLPFALTDDNWMYFLPLLKSQSDALLAGHWLSVNWAVGPGWSPWESGQAGFIYPPYIVANLIARLLGEPLAMLDVSAAMHIAATGVVAYRLMPASIADPSRILLAFLCQFSTGPLLLGLNWHNYLTLLPWFLAIGLLMIRHADGAPWKWGDRLMLWVASVAFFIASHVQMYVFGVSMLLVWAFVISAPKPRVEMLKWLIVAQLPAIFPLLYLKWVALGANPDWFAGRELSRFALSHAQHLGAVLQGTLWGNLLFTGDFRLWAGIDWRGIGIFFSPGLLLGVPMWLRQRRYRPIAFFTFGLILMGIASVPVLQYLFVGPFAGFRWTWKLAALISPLAMLTFIRFRTVEEIESSGREVAAMVVLVVASVLIFVRGLQFEILPSLADAHPAGPRGLVQETRAMASVTGLRDGTRIALIGQTGMSQPLPLPILGLLGNSPILSGLESAHIYEPMEPAALVKDHLGLTLPWRGGIPEAAFLASPATILRALRNVGVQAAISMNPAAMSVAGTTAYRDSLGRFTYVTRIDNALPGPFPDAGFKQVSRMGDGRLSSPASDSAPELISSRPIRWTQQTDRTWVGVPQVLSLHWALGTVALTIASLLVVFRFGRQN